MISYLHAGFECSVHLCSDGNNLSNPVEKSKILQHANMQLYEGLNLPLCVLLKTVKNISLISLCSPHCTENALKKVHFLLFQKEFVFQVLECLSLLCSHHPSENYSSPFTYIKDLNRIFTLLSSVISLYYVLFLLYNFHYIIYFTIYYLLNYLYCIIKTNLNEEVLSFIVEFLNAPP